MQFMRPGRLLRIRDAEVDWAWGVLVRPRKETSESQSGFPGGEKVTYVLDVLLICSAQSAKSEPPRLRGASPASTASNGKTELSRQSCRR